MSDRSQRPSSDDHDAWKAYWVAQGMPWRTEPEVDEERQRYLAERRAVKPGIEKGIYPFKDIPLDRADVEWLLVTHESCGMRGPVDWRDEKQRGREGLDLRGSFMQEVNLSGLPLARLRVGLTLEEWQKTTHEQRHLAAATLSRVNLSNAHIERGDFRVALIDDANLTSANAQGANLTGANLRNANLTDAHLEDAYLGWVEFGGALLRRAHLERAVLKRCFFNTATDLTDAILGTGKYDYATVVDTNWNNVNVSVVGWASRQRKILRGETKTIILGDERNARQQRYDDDSAKASAWRVKEFEMAVRANRQLATVLRDQGINEDADRFAYRAQFLERQVLRRQRRWLRYLGSVLLDLISGYGYRPLRSFITYVVVNGLFAVTYALLAYFNVTKEMFTTWDSPLVLSVTSFHGRVFFAGGLPLTDWVARVGAIEAVIGLLIEIVFIATFTQRFFAR